MKRYTGHPFRLFFFLAAIILISVSCGSKNKAQNKSSSDSIASIGNSVDSTKVSVISQKYSTGIIKAEITVKGNKREGITRNYHEDGSLMSELNYVNNQKDGVSRDFYPNKKVRMEVTYKKGIMEGEARWYYQTGEVYRVTPYIKGKAEGIQKLYYKDGKVKAEVPYKSGNVAPGLKEYSVKGDLLPLPSIVIEVLNKDAARGDFVLKMHLSSQMKNVKWYEGDLADWSNFPKALTILVSNPDGYGSLRSASLPGNRKIIYIYAVAETEMGNQLVLMKKYS